MATENERCFGDHVRRTTGEGKGRGKLPAGQDRHPEAENGLLREVGKQAQDLEHPKRQSESVVE